MKPETEVPGHPIQYLDLPYHGRMERRGQKTAEKRHDSPEQPPGEVLSASVLLQ